MRALPAVEVRHELSACSMAAAPGVFLLVGDLIGFSMPTAVDVALWLGVLTLVLCT
ncbi:hypothetical protein PHK61_24635 [Actinomycetospora lutea]|uniref:hypothetical protein n=1 Tax=Actinomycetospora lutea TaxID=663604 RepID=UPI00236716BB|nr:hypothetical protein [Actinomycetospora lutea]MDD7941613.1 hypothetical protein [Actinomycetospora lutea]